MINKKALVIFIVMIFSVFTACGKVFRLNIGQIASGSAEGLEKQSEPVEEKTKKKRVKKERAPKKVNPKKLNKKAKKAEQEMVISNELAAQAE